MNRLSFQKKGQGGHMMFLMKGGGVGLLNGGVKIFKGEGG